VYTVQAALHVPLQTSGHWIDTIRHIYLARTGVGHDCKQPYLFPCRQVVTKLALLGTALLYINSRVGAGIICKQRGQRLTNLFPL
jgi:hypothetical protein